MAGRRVRSAGSAVPAPRGGRRRTDIVLGDFAVPLDPWCLRHPGSSEFGRR
jgi:hypothetical protein